MRLLPRLVIAAVAVTTLIPGIATGSARSSRKAAHRAPTRRAASAANASQRLFSPTSIWNRAIPESARKDSHSRAMISDLLTHVDAEIHAKNGPWLNARQDGLALITVPRGQRTVRVKLDHAPDAALTSAWRSVPLPRSAHPSPGDNDLAVWQPSTDRLWEFFQMHRRADGWHAEWGGAIQHVSSDPGVYGTGAWKGAKPWWGVTATSLSVAGGVITFSDLAAKKINHALALVLPDVRHRSFVSPARRDDGSSLAAGSIPEGAHLRLDPSIDIASLDLPPLTRMIAEAAQRYGIVVRDYSPIVAFVGQDPTYSPLGSSLYSSVYDGLSTGQLMGRFPWSHLQVIKMHVHNAW
jgi:hypothetical protein